MISKAIVWVILMWLPISVSAQKLTLSELLALCSKKDWESVNQYLQNKGWEYNGSSKENEDRYNNVTWSFDKNYYDDKAKGWFYFLTSGTETGKISYVVANKAPYLLIYNNLLNSGFKLVGSDIEDDFIIARYESSGHYLNITTFKEINEDYGLNSNTNYKFTMIKKNSVFDYQNGLKIIYDDQGNIQEEYTLVNGQINGSLVRYYSNGLLKSIEQFVNGIPNGEYTEYDSDGKLSLKCLVKNGKRDGFLQSYENGKLIMSSEYVQDTIHGNYTKYLYKEYMSDTIVVRISGLYNKGLEEGKWSITLTHDGRENPYGFSTYRGGILNGPFCKIELDTVVYGNFLNGKLNDEYKIFIDLKAKFLGHYSTQDSTKLNKYAEGFYQNGEKTGQWYYRFVLGGKLAMTGSYHKDLKTGQWKYYYPIYYNSDNSMLDFSGSNYLVENYSCGLLNGRTLQTSYVKKNKVDCPEASHNDSCFNYEVIYITSEKHYKNGILNGPSLLMDSNNVLLSSGSYLSGLKDGIWTELVYTDSVEGKYVYAYEEGKYLNDKRDGSWILYVDKNIPLKKYHYNDNTLNGDYITYSTYPKLYTVKSIDNGSVKLCKIFDKDSQDLTTEYEVLNKSSFGFKIRISQHSISGRYSQEYWIVKDDIPNIEIFEFEISLLIGEYSSESTGYEDGTYTSHDFKGHPLVLGTMYKGHRIGNWKYYYYDQGCLLEVSYKGGLVEKESYFSNTGEPFSGELKIDNIDEGITEFRKVKDGLRNGKTTFYDKKTSKVIRKVDYKDGVLKE